MLAVVAYKAETATSSLLRVSLQRGLLRSLARHFHQGRLSTLETGSTDPDSGALKCKRALRGAVSFCKLFSLFTYFASVAKNKCSHRTKTLSLYVETSCESEFRDPGFEIPRLELRSTVRNSSNDNNNDNNDINCINGILLI